MGLAQAMCFCQRADWSIVTKYSHGVDSNRRVGLVFQKKKDMGGDGDDGDDDAPCNGDGIDPEGSRAEPPPRSSDSPVVIWRLGWTSLMRFDLLFGQMMNQSIVSDFSN